MLPLQKMEEQKKERSAARRRCKPTDLPPVVSPMNPGGGWVGGGREGLGTGLQELRLVLFILEWTIICMHD